MRFLANVPDTRPKPNGHLGTTQQTLPLPRSLPKVPFNGVLTNRLLTGLPGEDLARLLPLLEPVFLTAGHELYEGPNRDFAYFPETAVLSHLFFLEDGSSTGAAIIGND